MTHLTPSGSGPRTPPSWISWVRGHAFEVYLGLFLGLVLWLVVTG